MGKSVFVQMLYVVAPGEERLIFQEYDNGIINHMIGVRSMMVPVTPRLGVFVDPRKTGVPFTGTLITPMAYQPTRLYLRGRFVVLAFEDQKPVHLTKSDLLKFKKLYRPRSADSPIQALQISPEV